MAARRAVRDVCLSTFEESAAIVDFLEYKGRYTHIFFSAEDGCNYGEIEDIESCISFDDAGGEASSTLFEMRSIPILKHVAPKVAIRKSLAAAALTAYFKRVALTPALKAAHEGESQNDIAEEPIAAYA